MQDIWMIGIVALAVPMLMIGAISFALRFFVVKQVNRTRMTR